jgi:hypothetical protein
MSSKKLSVPGTMTGRPRAGSFTARGMCDHGAERGRAADAENGRPDIEAGLLERLVVRVLDEPFELGACGCRGQRAGQSRPEAAKQPS